MTHSGIIRENTVKKNGVKSVSRMCSGVCTIQLREKAIVESPTYGLAASADLSTTGTAAYLSVALVFNNFFSSLAFFTERNQN